VPPLDPAREGSIELKFVSMASLGWPEGRRFAFTIFDDPDSQTFETGREVYALLRDLGFHTTKAVWPVRGGRQPSDHGITCADDPAYVQWLIGLENAGFEIGYHNATLHTSNREETIAGLNRFAELFGHNPESMAHHYFCNENLYWGDGRVSGFHSTVYNALTRWKNHKRFFGHVEGHPLFWGDLCRTHIRYVRNFVFADINTVAACPEMPYHDPARPYVNHWFASSEGSNIESFLKCVSERNQDRLAAEGGGCIMYTHFGHGYVDSGGKLDPRFRRAMERLAKMEGWFVPVTTMLDSMRKPDTRLSDSDRQRLERRWLIHKVRFGTA
jgi:hypothetical protein